MADPAIIALQREVGSLRTVVANLAARLSTGPTILGMAQLRARWPGLSEAEILAQLKRHAGYQPQTGRRVRVSIDQVLVIERAVAEELSHSTKPVGARQ